MLKQIVQEFRVKLDGISYMPFVVFFCLAILLIWANYPIGIYDLGGDMWTRANFMRSFIDGHNFSEDYFMSNKNLHRYYTEMYLHLPFYIIFGNYERYISFQHFILFFLYL